MTGWTDRRVSRRTVRGLIRAWLAAAAILLLAFAGVAAQGAWQAIAAQLPADDAASSLGSPARVGGSPAIPVAAPSPAPGVMGTIALPTLPLPANLVTGQNRAAAFAWGRASAIDRGRALECLAAAIWYEAGSESDAGQQAVAQVVLNRVRHPAFPHTVCGVVYQGSERTGCQFSFACNGAMTRVPSRNGWVRAASVAAMALGGRVYAPVGLATHYHTYAVTPAWNRALVMTGVVGAHFFHRWKGWWGTPAAFAARYAGGEPAPGAHPAAAAATVVTIGAEAPLPLTAIEPASVRPARVDSGQVRTAVVVATANPSSGSGEMLDQWKDSGTPLRWAGPDQ